MTTLKVLEKDKMLYSMSNLPACRKADTEGY